MDAYPAAKKNVPDALDSFNEGLARLLAYAHREHDTFVPHNHQEGYFELGQWVEDVREPGLALRDEQREKLNSIDGWTWDIEERRVRGNLSDMFDARIKELGEFVAANGHARVPQMVEGKTTELGDWVHDMRSWYKQRKLSNWQVRRILQYPGWEWDAQYASFLDFVAEFKEFVQVSGHARVPAKTKLGRKIASERRNERDGKHSAKRTKILSELSGWR